MARSLYGGVILDRCDLVLEERVIQSSGCSGSHGNEDADTSSNGSNKGRGESEGRKTPTERVDDAAQPLSTVSIQVNITSSRNSTRSKGKAAGGVTFNYCYIVNRLHRTSLLWPTPTYNHIQDIVPSKYYITNIAIP